eukprot:scaffold4_cov396-Prasinococcus_capsulatus_cf.AAC.17
MKSSKSVTAGGNTGAEARHFQSRQGRCHAWRVKHDILVNARIIRQLQETETFVLQSGITPCESHLSRFLAGQRYI